MDPSSSPLHAGVARFGRPSFHEASAVDRPRCVLYTRRVPREQPVRALLHRGSMRLPTTDRFCQLATEIFDDYRPGRCPVAVLAAQEPPSG